MYTSEEELKKQSAWFLQTAKEQGWLTPEIEKEEKAILTDLLDEKRKNSNRRIDSTAIMT